MGLCHADKESTARVCSESEGRFTLAVCCASPLLAWLTTATAGDATLSYGLHRTNSTNTLIRPYTRYVEVVWWPSGKSYSRRERESSNFCGIVIKTNPPQSLVLLPSNFCVAVHHARKEKKKCLRQCSCTFIFIIPFHQYAPNFYSPLTRQCGICPPLHKNARQKCVKQKWALSPLRKVQTVDK